MTPQERIEAERKKAEKKLLKGIATPIEPELSTSNDALPEEPAIKPRRTRGSHK